MAHIAHGDMLPEKNTASFTVTYSLAHVEGEAEVLFLGEKQDEKVITRLTLLDGRIQTYLYFKKRQTERKIFQKRVPATGKCLFGVRNSKQARKKAQASTYHKEHLPLILVRQQE